MDQYLDKAKEIIKQLTNNGCEAYFIGEATRNEIMGLPIENIEIATSASSEILEAVFPDLAFTSVDNYHVALNTTYGNYLFTTFRSANDPKDKITVLTGHYSNAFREELHNRDFTINSIAKSASNKFCDPYGGFADIRRKRIRGIGNLKRRFEVHPENIIGMLKLHSQLCFAIAPKTIKAAKANARNLLRIQPSLYLDDLVKVFEGKYIKKTLKIIADLKLYKYIPTLGSQILRMIKLGRVEDMDSILINAFTKERKIDERFLEAAQNLNFVKSVSSLAIATPKSEYDNLLLFNYGLEVAVKANIVNSTIGKAKRATRKIEHQYELLPIKKVCDLEFKGEDILILTNGASGDFVTDLMDDIIFKVLHAELDNDYDILKVYAVNALRHKGVLPPLNVKIVPKEEIIETVHVEEIPTKSYYVPGETPKESEIIEDNDSTPQVYDTAVYQAPQQAIVPSVQSEIEQIKRILLELESRLTTLQQNPNDNKLRQDLEQIVQNNIAMLENMNYNLSMEDRQRYEQEIRAVYQKILATKRM